MMRHETQVDVIEQLFAHPDAGTTAMSDEITVNSVNAYTCIERLQREQVLFLEEAIVMGLSCILPSPRTYITDDNTGIPILLVRDGTGKARAFLNACKHRSSRLLDGAGSARPRIVCLYHAWTYELCGKLVTVPQEVGFPDLDFDSCSLSELPLLEEHGLIWVRPSRGEPISSAEVFSGLQNDLANYEFGCYHHYETRRIDCDMNWKVIVDTFLEPYHFTPLHNDTVAPIFFPSLCLLDTFGRSLIETLPRRTIETLRNTPKNDWDLIPHSAVVYVLFPNTVVVMQIDHAEIWRVFPTDNQTDKSHVFLEFYLPEPATTDKARAHWDRNMDLTIRTVQTEDFPTGAGAQKAFNSGQLKHVIYGRNEPALAFYQRQIAEAVGNLSSRSERDNPWACMMMLW